MDKNMCLIQQVETKDVFVGERKVIRNTKE